MTFDDRTNVVIQALFKPESVSHVHELLYSRIPSGMCGPLLLVDRRISHFEMCVDKKVLVVYDRACQAARYCRDREPRHFSAFQFRVDHFHADNHVCSQVLSFEW